MSDPPSYDVAVVGGGPAGLTTALYATRLGHRTALFEQAGGRHAAVENVHNLVGVSEDVSGRELAELGIRQLEEYGADCYPDAVTDVMDARDASDVTGDSGDGTSDSDDGPRFRVEAAHGDVRARRVVLATGFTDRSPDVPGLERFTGRGLHYCLHCDAYALADASVFVLGHDDHAAHVAMLLCNFTDDVDLLLDGAEPTWDDDTARQVRAHPVERVDASVVEPFTEDAPGDSPVGAVGHERVAGGGDGPWLAGLTFADGSEREYLGGFAMYGADYNTGLAESLDCDLNDDGSLAVDGDGETSVDGVYAVGDVTHGQNQTPIAMGDGARTGIALHRDLRRYPVPADELVDAGRTDPAGPDDPGEGDDDPGEGSDDAADPTLPEGSPVPGVAPDLRARMRRDRTRDVHAGLRNPRPDP